MMVDEQLTTRLDPCCRNRMPRRHETRDRTPTPLAGNAVVVIDSWQER
jgi:hypothetical protein